MNIVKKIVKNQKNKIYHQLLPETGKIEFFLTIENSFDGLVCFFCSSNENLDPSMHLSLESSDAGWHILLGRHNPETESWMHLKSNVVLKKQEKYHVEVIYGNCKNQIEINGKKDGVFIESENMNFPHNKNELLSFGDLNNIVEKSPIKLENFDIKERYNGKNSSIFHVQKPKVLDIEECRIFI